MKIYKNIKLSLCFNILFINHINYFTINDHQYHIFSKRDSKKQQYNGTGCIYLLPELNFPAQSLNTNGLLMAKSVSQTQIKLFNN